jgi:hypothetical protein
MIEIIRQMKGIATDVVKSAAHKLNPKHKEYCF